MRLDQWPSPDDSVSGSGPHVTFVAPKLFLCNYINVSLPHGVGFACTVFSIIKPLGVEKLTKQYCNRDCQLHAKDELITSECHLDISVGPAATFYFHFGLVC